MYLFFRKLSRFARRDEGPWRNDGLQEAARGSLQDICRVAEETGGTVGGEYSWDTTTPVATIRVQSAPRGKERKNKAGLLLAFGLQRADDNDGVTGFQRLYLLRWACLKDVFMSTQELQIIKCVWIFTQIKIFNL